MEMPPTILRLALEITCFSRHLTLHGVTADGALTLSAILAGASFATGELFVVMAEVCDDVQRVWSPLTDVNDETHAGRGRPGGAC